MTQQKTKSKTETIGPRRPVLPPVCAHTNTHTSNFNHPQPHIDFDGVKSHTHIPDMSRFDTTQEEHSTGLDNLRRGGLAGLR